MLNWQTVVAIIEIFVGAIIAVVLFVLGHWASEKIREMTERIDILTQQKAISEQQKKEFECQRIIKSLQDIQEEEQSLKTYLDGYTVEEPTNEIKLFEIKLFGYSFENRANNSINTMYDAIGQLQNLKDNTLRNDLLGYLRRFYVIPDRILKHNFPQQKHQRDNLLSVIKEQTEKIQEFINRSVKK